VSSDQQDLELAHIGYVVTDMKGALKRFVREGAKVVMESCHDPVQKVHVAVVELPGGVTIELVAPDDSGSSPVQSRLDRGGGLDHLCYYADDVQAAIDAEVENGAVVVCEPVFAVAFKRTVAFVHRRTGLVVEYMSRAEVSAS